MLVRGLPYALLALLVVVELPAVGRRRPEAQKRDRGSFLLVNGAIGLAMFSSFWLAFRGVGALAPGLASALRLSAIVVGVLGAALRIWSIQTLGRYFTRTVHVSADQPVVEVGPYRLLRHPSYSGLGLLFIAIALSLGSWIPLVLIPLGAAVAGSYRIRVEEQALIEAIGDPYRSYMQRTKRLIPFVL